MTGAPSMMLIQQEIKKVSDSLKTDLTFKYLVYFRLCHKFIDSRSNWFERDLIVSVCFRHIPAQLSTTPIDLLVGRVWKMHGIRLT